MGASPRGREKGTAPLAPFLSQHGREQSSPGWRRKNGGRHASWNVPRGKGSSLGRGGQGVGQRPGNVRRAWGVRSSGTCPSPCPSLASPRSLRAMPGAQSGAPGCPGASGDLAGPQRAVPVPWGMPLCVLFPWAAWERRPRVGHGLSRSQCPGKPGRAENRRGRGRGGPGHQLEALLVLWVPAPVPVAEQQP